MTEKLDRPLTELETALLSTLVGGQDRYGLEIRKGLEKDGRAISIGGLYTILDRLTKQRLVTSRWGEATKDRRGARRRYYRLTALGEGALRESLNIYARTLGRARRRLAPEGA